MSKLIYDFRFLFYGFIIGGVSSKLVTTFTEMNNTWTVVMSVVIVVALFPIGFALDNKFIKKGDN